MTLVAIDDVPRRERSPELWHVIDVAEQIIVQKRLDKWMADRVDAGYPPSAQEILLMRRSLEGKGGITWIAQAVRASKQAVSRWYQVPVERVSAISEATGIPRYKIRPDKPDLFPHPRVKKTEKAA
jgi:hypothetical protein